MTLGDNNYFEFFLLGRDDVSNGNCSRAAGGGGVGVADSGGAKSLSDRLTKSREQSISSMTSTSSVSLSGLLSSTRIFASGRDGVGRTLRFPPDGTATRDESVAAGSNLDVVVVVVE